VSQQTAYNPGLLAIVEGRLKAKLK
jgi:hypothetical protein